MTLHRHKVDDRTIVEDGNRPLQVPSGWEIAQGTADDIGVCKNHPWQTSWLVFARGDMYGTAICANPSFQGESSHSSCGGDMPNYLSIFPSRLKIGQRSYGDQLEEDQSGTRSLLQNADVLLCCSSR
jgi:hypothetical protein